MAAGPSSAGSENLSLPTLVVAALASAAAAVLVSQFSESGSAMAAALTAIFVPLLREAFHRPAKVISEKRPGRVSRSSAAAAVAGGAAVHEESETRPIDATTRADGAATATAGLPAESTAASGPETHRLEADLHAFGSDPRRERAAEGEPSFFGGASGVPGDMLERDGRTLEQGAAPDTATRRLEGGEGASADATRRLAGGGGAPDDPTRRLDANGGPAEHETRRLEADTASDEAPTRAIGGDASGGVAPGGAAARAARQAGAGSGAAATGGNSASRAGGARRALAGRRPRMRIAMVTGLLAFVIAAVVITVPELITGGSIGGGEGRTTLFSGGSSTSDSNEGIEDGALDGGGEDSDGTDGGGSSEPDAGGGGDSGGEGDAGTGSGEPGGDSPDAGTPAPSEGGGAGERSGGADPAPGSAPSPGGADAPAP